MGNINAIRQHNLIFKKQRSRIVSAGSATRTDIGYSDHLASGRPYAYLTPKKVGTVTF